MNTPYKLRAATPEDLPAVVGLIRELAEFEYLEDLYVQPAHRRHGLGQLLLRHLAQIAVARGYGRFEWSVLDWNENAIGFYEKMGAAVLPDWRICRVTGDALAAFARA